VIDPANPYPRQFTGHLRVTLRNGEVREMRQGHFRGGVEEPLSFGELVKKFKANCEYGGVAAAQADALLALLTDLPQAPRVQLEALRLP
jgi:hypothetical protein